MNVFSSDTNKNRYDEKLNQHKMQSSNFGNSYNYQERNSHYQNDNKSVDLSAVIRQSVVANIQKHGFEFARTAILEAISKNYFGGFTRSVRKQMEDIGKLKIFEIISASSITDGDVNIEQVVMNYLTDLIYTERDFKDQVTSIDQAACTTFLKYDSNGVINQTLNALNRFSDLGDATGEMGPFGSEKDLNNITHNKSSWYKDYSNFANSYGTWFERGGHWAYGTADGAFAFVSNPGDTNTAFSYRIVLAPTK